MPLLQHRTLRTAAAKDKPRLTRQNARSNLAHQKDDTNKRTVLGGIPHRSQRVAVPNVPASFEVFCDSPEEKDNNIIHQLEKQEACERKDVEQPKTSLAARGVLRAKCSISNASSHVPLGLHRSVDQLSSSTSVYEDACSSVYGSALESQSRPVSPTDEVEENEETVVPEPRIPSIQTQIPDNDVLFCHKDYTTDVYNYMRQRQALLRPNPRYLSKQADINSDMRTILIDWLGDVCNEYSLQLETLCLAVALVDRLLSRRMVSRMKLQLVGTAALFIASKFEEIYPPELKDFTYVTDETFSGAEVLKMERLVLGTLEFEVCTPTAFWFSNRLSHILVLPSRADALVCYLVELSLLDATYLIHPPSLIGAGAVHLARRITEGVPLEDPEVARLAMIQMDDLVSVSRQLADSFRNAPAAAQASVYEKYSDSSRFSVASLLCPDVTDSE